MGILMIQDEATKEEVILDTDTFDDEIERMADGYSFYFDSADSQSMTIGQLQSILLPFLLKSTIVSMKWVFFAHPSAADNDFMDALRAVDDSNPSEQGEDCELNYSEARFIEEYEEEVKDWLPLTFDTRVLSSKTDVAELVKWRG